MEDTFLREVVSRRPMSHGKCQKVHSTACSAYYTTDGCGNIFIRRVQDMSVNEFMAWLFRAKTALSVRLNRSSPATRTELQQHNYAVC